MIKRRYQRWNVITLFTSSLTLILMSLYVFYFEFFGWLSPRPTNIGSDLISQPFELKYIYYVYAPFGSIFIALFTLFYKAFYVPGGMDSAIHINGSILLGQKAALVSARQLRKKELKNDLMGNGIHLHPKIMIPMRRELGNIFVYGQQGTGKSVIIKPIIKEIIDRGDKAIIYDEKREYTPLFLDDRASIVNPTDARGIDWNPSLDITSPELAELLAESLISDSGEDEFWVKGARLIFAATIIHLVNQKRPWGWHHVNDLLNSPHAELKDLFVKQRHPASKLIEDQSKTTQGFFLILVTQLSWLKVLEKAWPSSEKSEFSLKRWVNDQTHKKVLIIPNDPLYRSISGPLCNAMIGLASRHLLSLPDSSARRVWFVLDELGNFPKCNSLLPILTLGRSKGARTIAGIQSISQLKSIYSYDNAETILSLFSNLICLRLGAAGGSAQEASKSLGERTIMMPSKTIDSNGQSSLTYSEKNEPVVSVSDITQLPQANSKTIVGYLSIGGWKNVYRLSWPIVHIPHIDKDYIPARWVKEPSQQGLIGKFGRRKKRRKEAC